MIRARFVLRRSAQAALTLWGLTLILFLIFRSLPGSAAQSLLGVRTTRADIRRLNHQLGVDRPVWSQYWHYLGRLVRGDLGNSITYNRSASSVITTALPTTLELALYSIVLTAVVTTVLATVAALHRDKPLDHVIRSVPVVGLGLPAFWIGTMLLFVFALKVQLFPAGGLEPGLTGRLRSLFLPALTLTILFSAILVRSLRASLIEVLDAEHVVTARAKGLRGARLVLRHVLPNAALPTITLLGLIFAGLLGGALIVESVFALPGVGALLVTGFQTHDFAIVQGIALFAALMILAMNILIDLVYSVLDPRVGVG
jgi:peptide/nickel transport system permease protein